MKSFPLAGCIFLLGAVAMSHADQIEMQNGDLYHGKVLAMTNGTLVVQSEVLGTLTVPREKVTRISLGSTTITNAPHPVAGQALTASPRKPVAARSALPAAASAADSKSDQQLIQQIQDEFLAGADPVAKSKYNELATGFMSGKLSVSDIRAQAKSAADQLRAARKDLGDDAGPVLDGYLAILDSFLHETTAEVDTTSKPLPKGTP